MIALGVDPSTVATGWGVLEGNSRQARAVDYGVLKASSRKALSARLGIIHSGLVEVLRAHPVERAALLEQVLGAGEKADGETAVRVG